MIAVILGSGMSSLIDSIHIDKAIEYQSFTQFDIIPLEGHDRIIYEATLNGQSLIILSGKLHMYEGYQYSQCISPLQYIHDNYSIDQWLVTSASGALSDHITVGDWQEVSDIITLENIYGINASQYITTSQKVHGSTYAYQRGPSLGTVAEYKMLLKFGADLVGMSMAPELIFLKSVNAHNILYSLPVCTYHPISYDIREPSHQQVIKIAEVAVPKLVAILSSLTSTS